MKVLLLIFCVVDATAYAFIAHGGNPITLTWHWSAFECMKTICILWIMAEDSL